MNWVLGKKRMGFWFGALATIAFAVSESSAKEQWLSAKTEHFEVLTNARQNDARLLVARLEQFRENFLRIVPGGPFHEPRTTIVIFSTERDFRPYKPLYKGKPKEDLAGVFQGNPDEVVIAMTTERDLEQTIPVIYHEYIHLLMHARGFRLPPWLNEGIAQLYETMEFESERVTVGRHNPYHIDQLNSSRLMPLAQLFAVTQNSPEYNEGNRRTVFYAQSWALLHYCLTAKRKGKELGEGFNQLITLMQLGYPPEKCMQDAYGMSLEEMSGELGAHMRGGRYVLKTYKVPKVDYQARVTFHPAADFERDVTLANLRWRMQQNGDATYQLLQLAEREPASPRTQEVLAAISMQGGERPRAVDYWMNAARLQTTNPYVYAALAEDSLRQYLIGAKPSFRLTAAASAELRAWLDRAILLDPNYAEAWDWLALTEAYSEKPRARVVKELQEKRVLFGNRPRLLAGFALIAIRINNPDFAGHLADALLNMPSVTAKRDRTADIAALAANLNGGNGSSWMLGREYYPEVLSIAKSVKRLTQQKSAADDESEPIEFEFR